MKRFAAAFFALVAVASLVAIGARFARRPPTASRSAEEASPASPEPLGAPEVEEGGRIEGATSPEASGIRELPPPPEGSPALRIVCLKTGRPLDEAWVVFRRACREEGGEASGTGEVDDSSVPKPGGFSGIRFRAQEDGIVRVALETLEGEKAGGRFLPWEKAVAGAPGYPDHAFEIDAFLAFLSPALPRSPPAGGKPAGASLPVLGLHPGAEWKGCVLDAQGRPLPGVWAFGESYSEELPLPRTGRLLKDLWVRSECIAQTDAEGFFRLRGLANLNDLARLEALGPKADEIGPELSGTFRAEGFLPRKVPLELLKENVVTLYRAVEIEGAVTDSAGVPIQGAFVSAYAVAAVEPSGAVSFGVLEFGPRLELMTGPGGAFRASFSDELVYEVRAEASGHFAQVLEDYRPRSGEKLLLRLRPWSKATARLFSAERKEPVARSPVCIFFPLAREFLEESTDADGRLSFPCPPETGGREILFLADTAGYARLVIEESSAEAFDLGDVFLEPGHSLEVLVVDGKGDALPGIELELRLVQAAQAAFTSLRDWGRVVSNLIAMRRTSGEDGRLSYEHLPAGAYKIEVVRPSAPGEKDGTGGRTWEIFESRDRVVYVPEVRAISVRLFEVGWIKGTVVTTSGESLERAEVRLVRARCASEDSSTDARGRFSIAIAGVSERDSREGLSEGGDTRSGEDGGPALEVSWSRLGTAEFPLPHLPGPGEELDVGFLELGELSASAAIIVEYPARALPPTAPESANAAVACRAVLFDGEGHLLDWADLDPWTRRVAFEDLEPGTYRVEVRCEQFLPWMSDPIVLEEGETRTLVPSLDRGEPLRGLVLDAETDLPIAGARAEVGECSSGADTAEDGRFELWGIPPRPVVLTVSMGGYQTVRLATRGGAELEDPIRLSRRALAGESRQSRQLWLEIARADGLPLAHRSRFDSPVLEWQDERGVTSEARLERDDARLYRSWGFPASGPLRLRVWFPDYLPSDWLSVRADEGTPEKPLCVIIQPAPLLTVLVTDQEGRPIPGVEVRVRTPLYRWSSPLSFTSAEGLVRIDPLPPGTYAVSLRVLGNRPFADVTRRIEYDGRGGPIAIALERAASLEVRLRSPRDSRDLRVRLGSSSCEEDTPGCFFCRRVAPGELRLSVWSGEGLELERRKVFLAPGEEEVLEIDLSALGSIEGSLAPGTERGILGDSCKVVLARGRDRLCDVSLGPDRTFRFRQVPPGRYDVDLVGVLGAYAGKEVEVKPGEIARVEIVGRTRSLRGKVLGPDGRAPREAELVVENDFGDDLRLSVLPGGRFFLEGLPEGPQTIRIEAPGCIPYRGAVPPNGDQVLEVRLLEGASVRGTIDSPDSVWIFWRASDGASGFGGRSSGWRIRDFEVTVPPQASALLFATRSDFAPGSGTPGGAGGVQSGADGILFVEAPLRPCPGGFEPVHVTFEPPQAE